MNHERHQSVPTSILSERPNDEVELSAEELKQQALAITLVTNWLKNKDSSFLPFINEETTAAFKDLQTLDRRIYIVSIIVPTITGLHIPTFSVDLDTQSVTRQLL